MGAALLVACARRAAPREEPTAREAPREEPATREAPPEKTSARGQLAAAPALQPPAAVSGATKDVPATAPSRGPAYRVSARTGEPQIERAPLGMRFVTAADAELKLDLPNGARLSLEAGSRAVLLDAEPATIVFLSGALYAQMPPQGSAAGRPVLRVVTPDYALSVPVAGELWLARPAAASGKTARAPYFAVLSGTADLERLGTADAQAVETLAIGGGYALRGRAPAAGTPVQAQGPRTLEAARSAHARGAAAAGAAVRDVDPLPVLDRALGAWDDAERRSREILSAQRDAKARGDLAGVSAGQREIVAHAQAKLAIRQRVRLSYELASARALAKWGEVASELARFEAAYAARVAPALPGSL